MSTHAAPPARAIGSAMLLVVGVWIAPPVSAQDSRGLGPGDAARVQPQAISGTWTSARHCLSGTAANIHDLGWIAAGSHYAVRFDAGPGIIATLVRVNVLQGSGVLVDGTPELRGTASTSGAMTLHVASRNGQPECYEYNTAIEPPSASDTPTELTAELRGSGKIVKRREPGAVSRSAISGTPSSAQHCVAGGLVPNVLDIGQVDDDSHVTVTFDADFDALAGVTLTTLRPDRGSDSELIVDDNSGNGKNPTLNFMAHAGENIVLYVTGANGAAGCYRYDVRIR